MLDFLAKKLVTEPEKVAVELFLDEAQQPVIELVVAPFQATSADLDRVVEPTVVKLKLVVPVTLKRR